jgi:lysozyme
MYDAIIDVSHHNGSKIDFAAAAKSGIAGVIHKATQGTAYVDPLYGHNREAALAAGLRFGSYHFGTGEDGSAQAEYYLRTVGPRAGELLTLDFEGNNAGPSMTLEEARVFVTTIHQQIGRWPVLYAGHYLKERLGGHADATLANCPLWLAQYGSTAVLPVGWKSWALWQWTDGSAGVKPQPAPGVGHCDRDRFFGDQPGLAAFWASVSPDPAGVAASG